MKADHTPRSIDEYIAAFPPEVRSILERIRVTIKKAAPGAEEKISYQMPSFTLKGHLVYFGAFKKHIGFYPPVRDKNLRRETSIYEGEKGNLRFPFDKPIPYTLISKIVKARVKENQKKEDAKKRRNRLLSHSVSLSTRVTRSRWRLRPRHPIHPSVCRSRQT